MEEELAVTQVEQQEELKRKRKKKRKKVKNQVLKVCDLYIIHYEKNECENAY